MSGYKQTISDLISRSPFGIDTDVRMAVRPPTMASSQFLTNKEQGDWAEEVVFRAINENLDDYRAIKYGRADSLAAGDPGFESFYENYQSELNEMGKRPDLLIFRTSDIPNNMTSNRPDFDNDFVGKAVAAIEVRSSSFLANRYSSFMSDRIEKSTAICIDIQQELMKPPLSDLLREKSPEIYRMIETATAETYREIDFRARSWSSSAELKRLSMHLRRLKDHIRILHKRDYLSITPKLEDLALVNRWIQNFGVKHFYLQVFFDKAYVIPFKDVLTISSDSRKEGDIFSVERDVKNQGKTTIKINVQVGREILGRIDMPQHRSALRELERGRLLFYVTFLGGRGYLDSRIFVEEIVGDV